MSEYSILGGVTNADVRPDPYPHIVIENCLPVQLYTELARRYPLDQTILELRSNAGDLSTVRPNSRHDIGAERLLEPYQQCQRS